MARTYKRKFTMRSPEEKEAIILEYFNDHHASYRKTADKYGVDNSRFMSWIKDELYIDFNLKKCDVLSLIKEYIYYYNHERPMYCLKYKTPHQYKTDMGY